LRDFFTMNILSFNTFVAGLNSLVVNIARIVLCDIIGVSALLSMLDNLTLLTARSWRLWYLPRVRVKPMVLLHATN